MRGWGRLALILTLTLVLALALALTLTLTLTLRRCRLASYESATPRRPLSSPLAVRG